MKENSGGRRRASTAVIVADAQPAPRTGRSPRAIRRHPSPWLGLLVMRQQNIERKDLGCWLIIFDQQSRMQLWFR